MKLPSQFVVLAGLLILSGCEGNRIMSTDLVAARHVSVQHEASDAVDVSSPQVIDEGDGSTTISGIVTRKATHNEPVAGHVDVTITDTEGQVVNQMSASLTPHYVPTKGDRRAAYSIHTLGVPPAGATVKVSFYDELHPPPPDADWSGRDTISGSGPGNGGRVGNGPMPGKRFNTTPSGKGASGVRRMR
jgi:hypothetical protein